MKLSGHKDKILPLLFAAWTLSPLVVSAQSPSPTPIFSSIGDVAVKLCTVFDWIFTFALIISFIYIVLAGIKYITAGGNPEKVKSVHQALIWAVAGIAVALVARSVPFIIAILLNAQDRLSSPC
jgi:hypothetical protein